MPVIKTIGIPPEHLYRPFVEGIRGSGRFSVTLKESPLLARMLETRGLDAGFVSPMDYARGASEYLIVPGAAVASRQGNNAVVIHFRKGSRDIRSLAVPAVSTSDIVLAKIMLAEKFNLAPTIVPVAGTLDDMLKQADAALLSGDEALRTGENRPEALDLVEEWVTTTDLPYVHGFCVGREDALEKDEWAVLGSSAAAINGASVSSLVEETSGDPERFSYDLDDDVRDGIREFLQYAYYHGILPDVPDLHFYGEEGATPGDPELN
jgi:chorismate dehydratase